MKLILFRHGIAFDPDHPDYPTDESRPLTPKGSRRTRAAARGLRALGVAPERVLTSPLVRAEETAAIVAKVLRVEDPPERTSALEAEADPRELLEDLADESRDVICVGHAPHLDRVVAAALGVSTPVTALRKAGAACIAFEDGPRDGRLLWVLEPAILRALGR